MSKERQPDNRKARKKKNIGKIPMVSEALSDSKSTTKQSEENNDD